MSTTFDQGREEVARLCQYFATNRQTFLAPGVKEAHVRQMLIEPLFEALGWDVRGAGMVAPQYREVVPEDSLDVEGRQKAPDYTFRVGTLPKFYAEAKKCGVNIGTDPAPAYQLRRYGWSAKVALSVLTDFEEFAVYDCTRRPRPGDKASYARIQHFRFEEYPGRWRELWDVFSRDAVWSGAFDQYAASKRKRGTSEVDEEFLKEIEGWRDALARNIALRNGDLGSDDLNAAVQSTIDRVVFLRMAEDRGLEPYEQLLKLSGRPDVYARFMRDLCRRADDKYNSGPFHFQKESGIAEEPDRLTPRLAVDDKVFGPILRGLYSAHGSPYHFGVLPVEILGTVYERFLGKVIRLTAGHQAKVEEKPEVRKAGGVYYTPAYIVDYIVQETVGRKTAGRSPMQLAGLRNGKQPLRVLDMACGSGSFLLGAYQSLLDHCFAWYVGHDPAKHKRAVYKDPLAGRWRLTIEEKKRILTTHVFGVDIDAQAVEVTKLSLLLKVLEGETDQSVSRQQQLFHDRALPNLAQNVRCGNSLIAPDYFAGKLIDDAEEMKRVNAFDWQAGFPAAIKAGGFDCIIGNPPYVLLQILEQRGAFDYIAAKYRAAKYKIDTYHVFLERALELTKTGGRVGYITPNSFLRNKHARELRRLILDNSHVELLRVFLFQVFAGASVDTSVLVLERVDRPRRAHRAAVLCSTTPDDAGAVQRQPQRLWRAHPDHHFSLPGAGGSEDLEAKMRDVSLPLGDFATAYFGIQTFDRAVFVKPRRAAKRFKPVVDGVHINRYALESGSESVDFSAKAIKSGGNPRVYGQPRIGVRQIGRTPVATLLPAGLYTLNTIYNIYFTKPTGYDLKFVLGIVSSKALRWYWLRNFFDQKETFPKIKKDALLAIPVPRIDFSRPADKARHDRMVRLVESMLALHEHLAAAGSQAQKTAVQRQIDATDAEIDRLVYGLYGLAAKEAAVVEEAAARRRNGRR